MENPASYILSVYSFISNYSLDKILNVGYQSKEGIPIPSFDENLLIDLCSEAEHLFAKENNILEINGDIIIVGDIHGSLHDLLRILKYIQGQNCKVIFLGDYVDRGNFSLECITILLALKITHPDIFYLLRGNHEFDSTCSQYGFKDEILNYHNPKKLATPTQLTKTPMLRESSSLITLDPKNHHKYASKNEYYPSFNDMNCYKYTEALYNAFMKTFSYLPIAAILNNTTFCIHGGLSPKLNHIDDINRHIHRPIDRIEDNALLSDVMWSDPAHNKSLFDDNPRGRGYLFNRESLIKFLKANSLTRLIRAHQCVSNGVITHFNELCVTVFSASSYDQPYGNYSSILQLTQQDDTIKAHTFDPLIRLEKSEADYYKVQPLCSNDEKSHICFSLLHPNLHSNANERALPIKLTRHIRCMKSDNRISQVRSFNSRYLQFSTPKFVTNQRKAYNFSPLNKSCAGDYDESSLQCGPGSVC